MSPLFILYHIAAFTFGITFGSFLNVCIHRIPLKLSIVNPGSACPTCKNWIKWFDNLPIFSWLILGGKCRYCKNPISPRYLFIELLTGLLFLLYAASFFQGQFFSPSLIVLAIHLMFLCILITCTIIDFEKQIIPDRITLPCTIIGIALSTFVPALHPHAVLFPQSPTLNGLCLSLLGALIGSGICIAIAWFGGLFTKQTVMGGGDIKMMLMIGAFLGPANALLVFFIAPIVALPIGLFVLFIKKDAKMPYGPYLAISSVLVVLCYNTLRVFLATYFVPQLAQ